MLLWGETLGLELSLEGGTATTDGSKDRGGWRADCFFFPP